MRQEFDRSTIVAIHKRATDKRGVKRCENPACRAIIKGGACHVDHILADGLRSEADKKRKLTPADGQLLCLPCHDEKTRKHDVPAIAKAKRREAAHLGVKSAPKMQSRNNLPKTEKRPKIDKSALPPLPRRNPWTGEIYK